jgi:hypothetical protein
MGNKTCQEEQGGVISNEKGQLQKEASNKLLQQYK